MNLLLLSDLHTDVAAARSLAERAAHFDVLIGAGDFGNARRGVQRCIDILRTTDRPTILVAGNNESTEELIDACRDWPLAHVLHGNGVCVSGIAFFGIGGGIPVTPFGAWSYDFTEDQATGLLASCPVGGVLVSHSPPKGAVDVSSSGKELGSVAVRQAVERCRPALVVCGHIHHSAGQQSTIGPSTIINAGPNGVAWRLT